MDERCVAGEVRLDVDGPVATITLDRPTVQNAMDAPSWAVFAGHLEDVSRSQVRVLVLTGANGTFCAGADTSARRRTELHPLDRMRDVTRSLLALQELPVPVIAKVDGAAVGAGLSLALCADFVVASRRSRFGMVFARRGLSLDTGASWLLPRAVGMLAAKRLAYLAEVIDAEEADRLGLVSWLVDAPELDAFTADLAIRLAHAAPVALRLDKELLGRSHERSFREAIEAENIAQVVNIGTDSPGAREALDGGRTPEFTGRWRA